MAGGELLLCQLRRALDLAVEGEGLEEAELPPVIVRRTVHAAVDTGLMQVFEDVGGAVVLHAPHLVQRDDLLAELDAVKRQDAGNHLAAPNELGAEELEGRRVLHRPHLLRPLLHLLLNHP